MNKLSAYLKQRVFCWNDRKWSK